MPKEEEAFSFLTETEHFYYKALPSYKITWKSGQGIHHKDKITNYTKIKGPKEEKLLP